MSSGETIFAADYRLGAGGRCRAGGEEVMNGFTIPSQDAR